MPEICRFYGIIIRMFWADHPPPHFHALYGEHEAIVEVPTAEIIEGWLPPRACALITEWVGMHREELIELWELARQSQPLRKIDPLP